MIGSLAWGDFGVRSDIDVAVERADRNSRVVVAERLGRATGRVVDVLVLHELPDGFRERVLREGLNVT